MTDLAAFRSLPDGVFEACDMRPGRVSSTSLVRYRNVDYSVPTAHAYTTVIVKGFVDEVVIVADGAEIARHPRSYEPGDMVCDPRHYLALIETKPGALDQAAPLQDWRLPPAFAEMRRLLETRSGRAGKREYIEHAELPSVVGAILDEVVGPDVVAHQTSLTMSPMGQCIVRFAPQRPVGLSLR
jgi:hypothetical protein